MTQNCARNVAGAQSIFVKPGSEWAEAHGWEISRKQERIRRGIKNWGADPGTTVNVSCVLGHRRMVSFFLTINLSDFQIPHRSNEGEGLDDLSKSSYNPMM